MNKNAYETVKLPKGEMHEFSPPAGPIFSGKELNSDDPH